MEIIINSKHGLFKVVIDDEDFTKVKNKNLYITFSRKNKETQKDYYRVEFKENKKNIKLHRFLLGLTDPKIIVDHINQNPLDNRKENLRTVTYSQNQRNRKARITSSSVFRGVYWNTSRNKWTSQITLDGKIKHLGHFLTEDAANRAFIKAEQEFIK